MSREFVELVALMRAAQKEYFRNRTQSALRESKRLEKEVDARVEFLRVQSGEPSHA